MLPSFTAPVLAASDASTKIESIGTIGLWSSLIIGVIGLLLLDMFLTRKPHEVSMKEALAMSAFYIALPLLFGVYIWNEFGSQQGVEYLTGYLVEKSLSVDNLFVFMLLLAAFAVPANLQQKVLLWGIIGALVLRGIFIALGAAVLQTLDFAFLIFGLILLVTAVKILRDHMKGTDHDVDVSHMRSVRLLRKIVPVTDKYEGAHFFIKKNGVRMATPFLVVVVAVFATDVVFAVDSVPAVYGITGDPFLVFATNAFALLGLRALYFVLQGALSKLVHLSYGLAAILAFIGVKLVLHWAHGVWESTPEIPTLASLGVIIGVLAITTATSLYASRNIEQVDPALAEAEDKLPDPH
jgi:tellurite resistance protein TerC